MPFFAPAFAAIGAAIAGFFTVAGLVSAAVGAVISFALSFAVQALFGKPKTLRFEAAQAAHTTLIRSPTQARRVIYGQAAVSGVVVQTSSRGKQNGRIDLVVALAGHECRSIQDLYVDDDRIAIERFDGIGVRSGKYFRKKHLSGIANLSATKVSHVDYERELGGENQAANATAVAKIDGWTTAHQLRGICYMLVTLLWHTNLFFSGTPNLRAVVRGKYVWDPRDTPGTIVAASQVTAGVVEIEETGHGRSAQDRIFVTGHSNTQLWGEYYIDSVTDADNFNVIEELDTVTGVGTGGSVYSMKHSSNPVLCILDFLVNRDFGLGVEEDELNLDQIKPAATTCDEQVALTERSADFVVATRNQSNLTYLEFADRDSTFGLNTGSIVRLTTSGTLMTGLSTGIDYYFVDRGDTGLVAFDLATSHQNAVDGTVITVTDNGSGTHTLTRYSQPRFTVNGVFDHSGLPIDILQDLVTTIVGSVVNVQGEYLILVGAADTGTVTLDEDDLRDQIEVQTAPHRRDVFNRVEGLFPNPRNFHQASEFPPVKNFSYEVQDGGRIVRDIELPFTNDGNEAQRLSKIILERSRQGIAVTLPCKLSALEIRPWDIFMIDNDQLGWSGKEFLCTGWKLSMANDGIGVDIEAQEFASGVFDWNLGEETNIDLAINTTIADLSDVPEPINLTLTSGTGELFVAGDGTVVSRIRVTWDDGSTDTDGNEFLVRYDIEAKNTTTGESYQLVGAVPPDQTEFFISPVEDAELFDVRVRAFNSRGASSDYTEVIDHLVIGKSEPPADVTGFSASQNGNVVTFRWGQVADNDLGGYEIRFLDQAVTFVWENATVITKVTRGTLVTNAALPPGAQTVAIKAVDTSGNESVTEATFNITVSSGSFEIAKTGQDHPRWAGTKTNFIIHDVSGRLIPLDTNADSTADGVFAQFVRNPETICTYEGLEIDLGFDADSVRVFGTTVAALGAGETTGVADALFEIDFRDDADSYDGFESWDVGSVDARFVKGRWTIDTSTGIAYLEQAKITLDVDVRRETHDDQVISIGGTTITWDDRFHFKPNVQVTADGATAVFPVKENVTVTSADVTVYDQGGSDVGGTVDVVAEGI